MIANRIEELHRDEGAQVEQPLGTADLVKRASCKIPIVDDAEGYFGVNSLIVYSAIRGRAQDSGLAARRGRRWPFPSGFIGSVSADSLSKY
jgi:hypothetical protein